MEECIVAEVDLTLAFAVHTLSSLFISFAT